VFEASPEDLIWTPTTRAQHSRAALSYGSDLTDAECAILEPFLPPPCGRERRRKWPMRRIIEAIFYVLRAGCAGEMLPGDSPPVSTVYRWFACVRDSGSWETINHHLVMRDRERVGRAASPSAAALDSQSAKTAEAGGPRGYDAGKKVLGRKRHALVDTDGRALKLRVHPASVQDRDGAVSLLKASRRSFRFLQRVFADSAYAGEKVAEATRIIVEIVSKPAGQIGFAVHPRRREVERFFAWLGGNRRFARDLEKAIASAQGIALRRLGDAPAPTPRTLLTRFGMDSEDFLQEAERRMAALARAAAVHHGVAAETRALARFALVTLARQIVNLIEARANRLGLATRRVPPGVGHDAQILAHVCPAGMIFVPSARGHSHNIAEFAASRDVENGATLLLATLLDLAGGEEPLDETGQ
jgi:transposase